VTTNQTTERPVHVSAAPIDSDQSTHLSWTRPHLEALDWSTTPAVDSSTDAVVDESTDDVLDRITADLDSVRGRHTSLQRAVRAFTVAMAVVVLFAMGTAAVEVQKFAVTAGFAEVSAWLLDPVVGLALVVLMLGETLIADAGGKAPRGASLVRHLAGGVTLVMNCWPSYAAGRADSVLLHAVMPALLIGFAAVAPQFRRALAGQLAQLRTREADLEREWRDRREEVATATARAELDRLARERAAEQEEARQREQAESQRVWREQEATRQRAEAARVESEQRIAEARELARIEQETAAARAAAAQAEAEAAARRERPPAKKTAAKKAVSASPELRISREDARTEIDLQMKAHRGAEPFALPVEKLQAEHGGSRSWWFARLDEVKAEQATP
jgi:hypothetical protein